MLECWNVGMLECWNVGMLECYNVIRFSNLLMFNYNVQILSYFCSNKLPKMYFPVLVL